MSNLKGKSLDLYGVQGILFAALLAIVLFAPRFLFFGTLGYSVLTITYNWIKHKRFQFKWYYILYIIFYGLFALSILWTEDAKLGLREIEFKLMFAAIPFIMALSNWKKSDLYSFTIVYNLVIFFCLQLAFITYFHCDDPVNGCFANARNAGLIHPTYMAMFATIVLLTNTHMILFEKQDNLSPFWKKIWNIFLVIFLCSAVLFVYMVDSKAGLLGMLIVLGLMFWMWTYRKFSRLRFYILTAIIGLVAIAGLYKVLQRPDIKNGIELSQEYIDDSEAFVRTYANSKESNTARILVWDASFKVFKENPMGVGPGDVRQELNAVYAERGMDQILDKNLNPHNQFLQTLLGLGIPGFLLLIVLFAFGLYKGIKTKNPILVAFAVIVIFNALFESILELQVGIFFFVFFSLIFDQLANNKVLS